MLKFIFYISFFLTLAGCTSCTSIFKGEKVAKTYETWINRMPSKLKAWERASRVSAKIAPLPEEYKEAVVQVYSAPLWGLRGWFADHTWISTKAKGADSYRVYEVIGWRLMTGHDSLLRAEKDIPDRLWYGKRPRILVDLKGVQAEPLVEKIHLSALAYPYPQKYSAAFGPNSNSFIAWVACQVPELNLKLSRRAIGKNYIKDCK